MIEPLEIMFILVVVLLGVENIEYFGFGIVVGHYVVFIHVD